MGNGDSKETKARHVLIVEDSELQALALKRIFEGAGYSVTIAKNGVEGITVANQHNPDVIVADIIMPVMNGIKMCSELKKSGKTQNIPVVLLTQLFETEEVIRGLEAGADNYVTKPFAPEYLVSKVSEFFQDTSSFENNPAEKATEFVYNGRHYMLHASRGRMLKFLISTYENVLQQYQALNNMQVELKAITEHLEEKVRERTKDLDAQVSERKAAEKALRDSEERFRAIVQSASDAVICLEPPDIIYIWNSKAQEIFGYSADEALGKGIHELIVPERYRKEAAEGLKKFFKTGTGPVIGKTAEYFALRKDGTEFPVEMSIAAVNMHGVWTSIGIVRDVTERKKMEENLKEHFEETERFNKIMVGREIKMEELRKEVRTLRKRVQELESAAVSPAAAK